VSHLPRKGQYELFTHNRKTYCFDDEGFDSEPAIVNAPEEMWTWLRSQRGCKPMDESNTAYYLTPQCYLLWKLKYAYNRNRI
jgi:hypothetical protein